MHRRTGYNKKLMPRNKEEFLVIGVWCVRGGVGHKFSMSDGVALTFSRELRPSKAHKRVL